MGKNQKRQIVTLDIKTIQSQFAKLPFSRLITLRTTEKSVCVFCVPSLLFLLEFRWCVCQLPWVSRRSINLDYSKTLTVNAWLCFLFSLSLTNFIAQQRSAQRLSNRSFSVKLKKRKKKKNSQGLKFAIFPRGITWLLPYECPCNIVSFPHIIHNLEELKCVGEGGGRGASLPLLWVKRRIFQ